MAVSRNDKYGPLSDEAKLRLCQTKITDDGKIDPAEYVFSVDHPANSMREHLQADTPKSDLGRLSRGLRRLIAPQFRLRASEILVLECLLDQSIDFKPTHKQIAYMVGCLGDRGVEAVLSKLCEKALIKRTLETVPGTILSKSVYDLSPLGSLLQQALQDEARRKAKLERRTPKRATSGEAEVAPQRAEPSTR